MCNQLHGSIPEAIEGLTQLQVLKLWNNTLSGPLLHKLGKNSPLQWQDISFTGSIPTALCQKRNLTKLILFNNAFSGSIPGSLLACALLVRVRMQNNLLSGTIPVGFGRLSKPQRLELANNSRTGLIPTFLFHWFVYKPPPGFPSTIPNLQNFIASGSDLVREIPDQFQDCPGLSLHDLSSYHFTGRILTSIVSWICRTTPWLERFLKILGILQPWRCSMCATTGLRVLSLPMACSEPLTLTTLDAMRTYVEVCFCHAFIMLNTFQSSTACRQNTL